MGQNNLTYRTKTAGIICASKVNRSHVPKKITTHSEIEEYESVKPKIYFKSAPLCVMKEHKQAVAIVFL